MHQESDSSREVMNAIRQIVRGLRVSSRAAEREVGVSGAQLFVLQNLNRSSALTINGLADATKTHQSSVSTVVTRLEAQGFVTRAPSPEDGRRVEVSITAKGRRVLENSQPLAQERMLQALHAMPARERDELARLLTKLTTMADLNDPNPPLFFEEDNARK